MARLDRSNAKKQQSPGTYVSHIKAHQSVIDQSGIKETIGKDSSLYDMFDFDGKNYQVHHIVPLGAVNPLFDNTTPEQGRQLQQVIGSGNDIRNLFVTPNLSHSGETGGFEGVHTRLKAQGLQPGGSVPLHPLLQEIQGASSLSFDQKMGLANRFKNELRGKYTDALDDALQENEGWANARGKAQAHLAKGELPM